MPEEINDQLIKGYGEKYGLEFHRLGDLGWTGRAQLAGADRNIGVNAARGTIIFSIFPLITVKCEKCKPALSEYLLSLNASTHLVKYGIDNDWNVQLTVQFPAAEISYGLFAAALDAIKQTVENHYAEIERRARD